MGWNWKRAVVRTRDVSPGFSASTSWVPWKSAAPRPLPCRKKALLIGINYGERLTGPQNDVKRMRRILIERYDYNDRDIVVLTDRSDVPEDLQPTHDNIMQGLRDFLVDQQPGDRYFFMYAGHADQKETDDENEEDGMSERILPVDGFSNDYTVDDTKVILDDELKAYLVDPLLPENHLTAIFDSSHSGTVLDLPHYRCNRASPKHSRVRRAIRRVREIYYAVCSIQPYHTEHRLGRTRNPRRCSGYCPRHETTNVVCISACNDSETMHSGVSMSMIIMDVMEYDSRPTLKKFMRKASIGLYVHGKVIEEEPLEYRQREAEYKRKFGSPPTISTTPTVPTFFVISSRSPLRMGAILSP